MKKCHGVLLVLVAATLSACGSPPPPRPEGPLDLGAAPAARDRMIDRLPSSDGGNDVAPNGVSTAGPGPM